MEWNRESDSEPEQVPIETYVAHLNSWLRDCNEHHDNEFQVAPIPERPPHHIPDWVIDTKDACIVRGCSVPRYVALSYVWRSPSHKKDFSAGTRLMLLKDNLGDFRTKGFLSTGILDLAPVVVRDAINLVQRCGARYLWVDCLCIVQHDDTTGDRVALMNEIYSGAYFTLIAAASTVFAKGLYGPPCLQNTTRYINNDKPSASTLHAELLCMDIGPFARRWLSTVEGAKGPTGGNEQLDIADPPQRYEFYNVLWVETIDGIKYRKAAGRVPKDVWEENCGQPEKIVLG
ncbi:hypothetical protein PG997_001960 [Apiospora hydei]|uniref:Heterokaryon incompatibility domain-containing protein n=1 Tax=Apiospora hydei TaxID=1337664 RepID=A0ABR1X804_9PEZI